MPSAQQEDVDGPLVRDVLHLSVVDVFQFSTIEEMAKLLQKRRKDVDHDAGRVELVSAADNLDLEVATHQLKINNDISMRAFWRQLQYLHTKVGSICCTCVGRYVGRGCVFWKY